ncbi:MAG: hypothetical protein V5B33_08430 [Candidatus Accumulibacter sp. UW20]|jgi:hypothetical protein
MKQKQPVTKRQKKIKAADAPRSGYQTKRRTAARCVLCGQIIKPGQMLVHKHIVHGEKFSSSTVGRVPDSQWVRIIQAGSPGLRKRGS